MLLIKSISYSICVHEIFSAIDQKTWDGSWIDYIATINWNCSKLFLNNYVFALAMNFAIQISVASTAISSLWPSYMIIPIKRTILTSICTPLTSPNIPLVNCYWETVDSNRKFNIFRCVSPFISTTSFLKFPYRMVVGILQSKNPYEFDASCFLRCFLWFDDDERRIKI